MKMCSNTVAAMMAVAWLIVGGSTPAAQEKKAPLPPTKKAAATTASPKDKMPAPIKAAFEKAYPKAIVKTVSSEKENGAVVWEVESTENGKTRDIIYTPDGTAVLIEDGLDEADLPQPVKEAVTARYPKGKMVRLERATKGSEVFYEMLVDVAGTKHAVEFNPDGKPHGGKKAAPAPKKKG